jgi:hypothetical protein
MRRVMRSHLSVEQTDFSLDWLRKSMTYGSMPYRPILDAEPPTQADWGRHVEIGAPDATGEFQLMEASADHTENFWELPQDLKNRAAEISEDLRRARDLVSGTPNVRYSTVKPADARMQHIAAAAAAVNLDPSEERYIDLEIGLNQVVEAKSEEEEEEEEEDQQWGAPAAQCVVGQMAVVEVEFADGSTGIDVVDVVKVRKQGDTKEDGTVVEEDNFDGVPMVLNKGQANTSACYTTAWRKGVRGNIENNNCWSVLVYFDPTTMTKKSRYLFLLPKKITKHLKTQAMLRPQDWFAPAPKLTESDDDHDSSNNNSDDDYVYTRTDGNGDE